jgi:hypothetical protein
MSGENIKEGGDLEIEIPAQVNEEQNMITEEDLKDMHPEEAELARKHGLVKKESEEGDEGEGDKKKNKPGDKNEEGDEDTGDKKKNKPDDKNEEGDEDEEGDKKKDKSEKREYKDYTPNEKAMYHEVKRERSRRQDEQAKREILELRFNNLNKKLEELKAKLENGKDEDEDEDDDDRPLTGKDLKKALEDQKNKSKKETSEKKDQEELNEKEGQLLANRIDQQDADAAERYEDYGQVIDLAKALIVDVAKNNGDKLLSDNPRTVAKVKRLYADMTKAMAKALELEVGDETSADIAYEIGQLHPEYKKPAGSGKSADKETKHKNADKIKKNAQKRQSSAALEAGGAIKTTVEGLTPEQAERLSPSEWKKLPSWKREQLLAG